MGLPKNLVFTAIVWGALALPPTIGADTQAGTAQPAGTQDAVATADQQEQRRRQRVERRISRAWWNRDNIVATLALSTSQRDRMSQIMRTHMASRAKMQKQNRSARQPFQDALAGGKLDVARAEAEKLAASMSLANLRQLEMMVDIIALLSDRQREILHRGFPHLLQRSWAERGGGRDPGQRRARRKRQETAGASERGG